jgi:hypothetical protein
MKRSDEVSIDPVLQNDGEDGFALGLRTLVEKVLAEALPGTRASYEIVKDPSSAGVLAVVSIPVGGFDLRLAFNEYSTLNETDADHLRSRIDEAKRYEVKFVARLLDARRKFGECLARHGGMRLVGVRLHAERFTDRFHWYESRLEFGIEFLGPDLKLEIEWWSSYTARAIASTIRVVGEEHVKRQRQLERLAANDALFEIEVNTEDFLRPRGIELSTVAHALLSCPRGGYPIEDEIDGVKHYVTTLYLSGGQIRFADRIRGHSRFVTADEIGLNPMETREV